MAGTKWDQLLLDVSNTFATGGTTPARVDIETYGNLTPAQVRRLKDEPYANDTAYQIIKRRVEGNIAGNKP
jgi:hypothetical protein